MKNEIDVKRFYLPILVHFTCPKCNNTDTVDLNTNYLSYPKIGESNDLYHCCSHCGEELVLRVRLNISVDFLSVEKQ